MIRIEGAFRRRCWGRSGIRILGQSPPLCGYSRELRSGGGFGPCARAVALSEQRRIFGAFGGTSACSCARSGGQRAAAFASHGRGRCTGLGCGHSLGAGNIGLRCARLSSPLQEIWIAGRFRLLPGARALANLGHTDRLFAGRYRRTGYLLMRYGPCAACAFAVGFAHDVHFGSVGRPERSSISWLCADSRRGSSRFRSPASLGLASMAARRTDYIAFSLSISARSFLGLAITRRSLRIPTALKALFHPSAGKTVV